MRIKCLEVTCLAHPSFLGKTLLRKCNCIQKGLSDWETDVSVCPGSGAFQDGSVSHISGCPALCGLQEERAVVVLAGRGMTAQNVPFQLCLKIFLPSAFPKTGCSVQWRLSLWTWAFGHFHLHLLKQTQDQGLSIEHLLGPSKPWKEALAKLWFFFLYLTGCAVESSEFWQKHKINWVSSKPSFGFQDPLINLRWKFFSPTEAHGGNHTLWFLKLSCNWSAFLLISCSLDQWVY